MSQPDMNNNKPQTPICSLEELERIIDDAYKRQCDVCDAMMEDENVVRSIDTACKSGVRGSELLAFLPYGSVDRNVQLFLCEIRQYYTLLKIKKALRKQRELSNP